MSEKRDPFDGDYIGSIFGPKLTLYGGLLILFFAIVVVYRHWKLDVPFGMEESVAAPQDTIATDSLLLRE
jgi:hypothetical protein